MTQPTPTLEGAMAALGFLRRDGNVALATVVETWGSAPVPKGGQMAIAANGEFQGSVSGGCIEGEVIEAAERLLATSADIIKPEILEFGVADETAWRVGLPCGGRIKVMVERLAGQSGASALEGIATARAQRKALVVRTQLSTGERTAYVRDQPGLPPDVAQRLATGQSGLVAPSEGDAFDLALVPPSRALVVGATHIAQVFARLAHEVGLDVHVIDPRSAFAAPERFVGSKVYAQWPQDAFPHLQLDAQTAVVVLAHVSHIDDEALKLACVSPVAYVGALGSSKNHAQRVERLRAAGLTPEQIARIKSPIGLEIGAVTPPEIALAVLAEVICELRGPGSRKRRTPS